MPVIIDEVPKGDFLVVLRNDDVLVGVGALERAGVRGFSGTRAVVEGAEYVSLESLGPEVSFRIDASTLTLDLTVPPRFLATSNRDLSTGRPKAIVYSRNASGFLNYSLSSSDLKQIDGFAEVGASLAGDLLYSSMSRTSDGKFLRGQTSLTIDRREQLQRVVVGDSFGTTGELGGGAFLAGVSVARAYDLDPYFVRYPTMNLAGAVTTPSTAEIYVNGTLVRREELPPGQFDFSNLQLPTGSGDVRVVIRDALGQERVLSSPFYASTEVLAEGQEEYSYDLGFLRHHLGTDSADYGPLAFVGHHRFGWNDFVTPEARIEATRDLLSGGAGVAWRLPIGEFSADVAASRDHGASGAAASFSYRYVARPASVGLLVRRMSDRYANLSLSAEQDRPTLDISCFAGVQLSRRASLSGQYSLTQMRDAAEQSRLSVLASLTAGRRGSLFISAGRVRGQGGSGTEAFLGYSFSFAGTATANISYSRQDGTGMTSADVERPLPLGEGFGYRVASNTAGGNDVSMGLVQYQGRVGRYDVEVDHTSAGTTKTMSVTGGLAAVGGEVLASRAIGNSFALVRVPDVKGVTTLVNNQPIGRTDSSGDVLVPDLLSYYGNRLGIKDTDIPIDYEVGATEETVAPPYRGGALVKFPVERVQSLRGRVVVQEPGRELIPSFGQFTLDVDGAKVVSPLGSGGEFDFQNLAPGLHRGVVVFREGICHLSLQVPRSNEQFIDLGTVRCSAPGPS
jgi:outer membrane usher protein